jgi:hypothetical protein
MSNTPYELMRLKASYETFGIVIDYLAGIDPFRRYEFGPLARAVQQQVHDGEHLAAVGRDRIVGYVGWLRSTEAIAERWQAGKGELVPPPVGTMPDTAALTIVAADDRRVMHALIARLRSMNPYRRIFFKREYAGVGRTARKESVGTLPHRMEAPDNTGR